MRPPKPSSSTPDPRAQLTRLASGHEVSLQEALVAPALDRRTRLLVQLAALLSVGAPTETIQWAVELAAAAGVDDEAVIAAFEAVAPIAGAARSVQEAPRLALALGFDVQD